MFIWWGDELINLYNDAYKSIVGGKHPEALGQPASHVWREIWEQVGPRAASAMRNNEGTYDESLLLIMERNGYPEETYYTFSYSPVPNDQGGTGGIFCANTDNTQSIIGERQLALLRSLAASTANARTFDTACTLSIKSLESNAYDIPFALIYLVDADTRRLILAGTTSNITEHPIAVETITLDENCIWSFAEVIESQQISLISNLEAYFNNLPHGAWNKEPSQAVVVPILPSGKTGKAGILIAGLNPFRLLDSNYKRFFELVSNTIAASIASAQAYEDERKRAEALAEIDRAKTVFFSNVSHEFRTPLTLMLSPVEDALTDTDVPLPPRQQERIEVVQRNSLRLLKLVNTLLDFSRIEAGRIQVVYEPTDLATFTADLASMFRSTVERVGMRLIIDCPELTEPVYVDREMWEKIVLNLLSNAFKFTFEGEIAVVLRQLNDHVELEVRDTGTGIPKSELTHIFERFHRVSGARGRSFEGSGIGLSLVNELVLLHSGTINVTSVVDQGTSFTISIPLGCKHLAPEHIGAERALSSTATKATAYIEEALSWIPNVETRYIASSQVSSNKLNIETSRDVINHVSTKILLADDNTDMREYVKRLLEEHGYTVEAVEDGITALAIIEKQKPDLVLTDIMMPKLDGLGLLQQLRTNPTTKEIPIILLSARAGEESRIEGLSTGADDYLIKPFSARELVARVEASLKLTRIRQESARREQIILERVTDAFVGFDNDLRFTYINVAAEQMMRKTPEEVLGKTLWEIFPDFIGTPIEQAYLLAIKKRSMVEFEEYYAAYNIWVEARLFPSPTGLSGFYRDVTERKQTQEALRQSETQFRQLADAMPQIAWTATKDGIPTYVNQRWIDYTGLTLEQTLDQGFIAQVIHPDDFEPTYEVWNTSLATGSLYQTEFRLKNITLLKEKYRWFLCRAIPIHDAIGQITQWYGTLTDITERKLAEKTLRESEERFRNMADNAPFMVWVTDSTGCCTYLSQSWYDFSGQTEATGLGYGWLDATHPEDREYTGQIFKAANARYEALQIEYRLRRHDGQYFWVMDAASPWFGVDGEYQGYIGSVIDISERKQAEAERARLLQLEQTARLEAEKANRIKDEFLAVLSHELRTPLNPILGWSKLLQSGKLNEAKAKEAITIIERNAKLQSELIEDLLDVSRILQGKLNLNIYPINLAATIEAAIETVQLAAEAKSIQVEVKFESNVGQVLGDAARLQQVVWNLLSNGVKFTPVGGRLQVELSFAPNAPNFAQITVSDTGKGISPEFLPHVFDYFRQADSTTTRMFGGLGLGLAIVRHLVELHGGTVRADSPGEGMGATFTIKLPLVKTESTEEVISKTSESSLNLNGIKILVVDDETDSRELVKFIVEQAGAEVIAADGAKQALTTLTQWLPNILISDIGMPEMNGYMLLQQVRTLAPQQGGQIPAIALTAYAGDYNKQQAIAAGFQGHIAKPIEPINLLKAIKDLIITPNS
jgi:PAS domain S-box-containing protein